MSSSQGWAKSGSGVAGEGGSGRRPPRATKVAHGVSPSPAARGTASSHLLPPSAHPRQRRTLSAWGTPGRLGGPGPFPSPGQRPGNKSLWDGEAAPAGGICLARGEVEGGKETAFQSVSPFVNPSKHPQCPPHGSSYSRVTTCPLREGTGSPPASLAPSLRVSAGEGKREKMGKEKKGKSSQEEGADRCGSVSPARPLSGWGSRGCPSPRD